MIAELIPKVIEDEQREKEPHIYYPRPSIAGIKWCKRAMVYWGLKYAKEPMGGRRIMTMEDSSFHELLTADRANKTAVKLHSSQIGLDCYKLPFVPHGATTWHCELCKRDIPPDVLHGHSDGILTDLLNNDWLWEHKAINHFSWGKIGNPTKFDLDTLMNYATQCAFYWLGLLKYDASFKGKGIILTLKNKNTSGLCDIEMEYDTQKDVMYIKNGTLHTGEKWDINKQIDQIVSDAIQHFADIDSYIAKKTLPKRQYDIHCKKEAWRCEYCRQGATCWENWAEEIAKMATDRQLDEEMAVWAGHYLECNMHIKRIQEEKDDAGDRIRKKLKELQIRDGRVGPYTISIRVQHRKEKVTPAGTSEVLSIRKPKPKKEKKK